MSDEIIQEIWQIKDEIAKECGYNLAQLVAQLRQKEKIAFSPPVDLSADTTTNRR